MKEQANTRRYIEETSPIENFDILIRLCYNELVQEADRKAYADFVFFYNKWMERTTMPAMAEELKPIRALTSLAVCIGKAISRCQKKFAKELKAEGQEYLNRVKVGLYNPSIESITETIDKTIFVFKECQIIS